MLSHLLGCILRISIHVRTQRTLTSSKEQARGPRTARAPFVIPPARPERTAYVYIFNADSQVRPHGR